MKTKFYLHNRTKELVFLLGIISVITIFLCLCIGRYHIEINDVLSLFDLRNGTETPAKNILLHIRIPRVLLAYLIGVALSVSGAAYQGLFHNRLVSPGVLGVNSGACVGASLCILLNAGTAERITVSFLFGIVAALMALAIQKFSRNKSSLVLVLAGIVVSAFMNAMIGIIKYVADGQDKLASITFWLLGSIANAEMSHVYLVLPFVTICSAIILSMGWRLNAMSLGEKEALSVGINYKAVRLIIVLCSTLLTSVSVSISGSIDWIGLIIPNISRSIVGANHRKMLPISMLFGGIFMTIVDTVARSISPNEIPLGIITGLFGAVTYLVILLNKKGIEQ